MRWKAPVSKFVLCIQLNAFALVAIAPSKKSRAGLKWKVLNALKSCRTCQTENPGWPNVVAVALLGCTATSFHSDYSFGSAKSRWPAFQARLGKHHFQQLRLPKN